ncbi:MAG: MtrB/PioB family outer membrane beta-barrel protein, partial [Bacteroidales bacterium]|nr:MtrB/PioB family outer membrane beta-barrel protein [Bacteroidales bacterium]
YIFNRGVFNRGRLGHMRLRGGVEWASIERTTRSVTRFGDEVDSTRLWTELRLPSLGALNWSLKVEGTDRDNSLSAARRAALDVAAPSQALPDYLLGGRAWLYQLQGDMPLSDTVMAAASYRRLVDDFDNDHYGLRGRDSDELSVNLSWQASGDVAVSAWGQYQEYRLSQRGLEFNPTAAPSHANAPWRQRIKDASVGAGFNVRWQVSPVLAASVDFSHSDNDSSYRSRWLADADTGEAAGTADSLPGYAVDVQRLDAALDWDYSDRTRIRLRYLYERFRSSDWAWDDDQFNALAFAWNSPRYDAHALLVSVRYQFREGR